jgi:hypothetical protein
MAVRGDFKLNNVWYKSANGSLPNQQLANQMAEKVGQGTSSYGDLSTWSAWIQDNWQDGAGKIEPGANGGFLYGEADSRVPRQLILPPLMKVVTTRDIDATMSDCQYTTETIVGTVTVGGVGNTIQRVAIPFITPGTVEAENTFAFFGSVGTGVGITMAVYSNSAGSPNVIVGSADTHTVAEDTPGGFYWYTMTPTATLSTSTTYWLVIYPTSASNSLEITYGTTGYNSDSKSYNGSAWAAITGKMLLYISSIFRVYGPGSAMFRFDGDLYLRASASAGYSYDSVNDNWDQDVGIPPFAPVATNPIVNFNGFAYWPNMGGGANRMNTSDTISSLSPDPQVFAKDEGGRLWRAVINEVDYTSDGTTWEPTTSFGAPVTVSDPDSPVTGMCSFNNNMYCATEEGLMCVMPGDFAKSVYHWDGPEGGNGSSMVVYDNAMYITVAGRIMRYTEDGSMQDVWMTRDEDAITSRLGKVWDLCVMNHWLLAYVSGSSNDNKPTIWAYQGTGWHQIATLPMSQDAYPYDVERDYQIFYDRPTHKLWATTAQGITFNWYVPDYARNPYNDSSSRYMRTAWMEWDWFDGSVLEAQKDYESVTIMGENFASGQYVKVYWKDDDSTTWELLGTCDSNNEELIWSTNRPNTKRLKLGIQMVTTNSSETPRIHAIRVKYHLMTRDWFRWSLAVDVSGRTSNTQQMAEEKNTLTASQIKDNISALATQVAPFTYQDVDENIYLVKVNDANFTYTKYVVEGSTVYWEGVYRLVIEQVRPGEYTP